MKKMNKSELLPLLESFLDLILSDSDEAEKVLIENGYDPEEIKRKGQLAVEKIIRETSDESPFGKLKINEDLSRLIKIIPNEDKRRETNKSPQEIAEFLS